MTADELLQKYKEIWKIGYREVVEEASQGKILADVNIGHYQGEEHFLVKKDDQYAHIVTGYGSCSYCDILQGIQSNENCWGDTVDFIESTASEILWKSHSEMVEYINHHDFKGSWYGCDTEAWLKFKEEVLEALNAAS
jgi:hypothetical protein